MKGYIDDTPGFSIILGQMIHFDDAHNHASIARHKVSLGITESFGVTEQPHGVWAPLYSPNEFLSKSKSGQEYAYSVIEG
jgi:hypothetical protein